MTNILLNMNFEKKIYSAKKVKEFIIALEEHGKIKMANVKNQNKAIAKYL